MSANFIFTNRSKEFIEEKNRKVEAALEALGNQAVSHAKSYIAEDGRIDTGLLRNSITHAISGKKTAISEYRGDNPSKYGKGKTIPSGSYSGAVPDDPVNKKAVYFGTNVDYAA